MYGRKKSGEAAGEWLPDRESTIRGVRAAPDGPRATIRAINCSLGAGFDRRDVTRMNARSFCEELIEDPRLLRLANHRVESMLDVWRDWPALRRRIRALHSD